MGWIQRKQSATILQGEAHAIHYHAGAERRVIALNERCDIPVFINCSQICSIAGGRMSGIGIAIRFVWIDFRSPLLRVALVQQASYWDCGKALIGVVVVEVGISKLHGLNFFV